MHLVDIILVVLLLFALAFAGKRKPAMLPRPASGLMMAQAPPPSRKQ
jgi:hypothetical protein